MLLTTVHSTERAKRLPGTKHNRPNRAGKGAVSALSRPLGPLGARVLRLPPTRVLAGASGRPGSASRSPPTPAPRQARSVLSPRPPSPAGLANAAGAHPRCPRRRRTPAPPGTAPLPACPPPAPDGSAAWAVSPPLLRLRSQRPLLSAGPAVSAGMNKQPFGTVRPAPFGLSCPASLRSSDLASLRFSGPILFVSFVLAASLALGNAGAHVDPQCACAESQRSRRPLRPGGVGRSLRSLLARDQHSCPT